MAWVCNDVNLLHEALPGERYNLEQGLIQKLDPESKNSHYSQGRENLSTQKICIASLQLENLSLKLEKGLKSLNFQIFQI